jgi:PAS domain S-box-containing protein
MRGAVRDITERKQTEEALLQKEERLRMALEAAKMAAWDWHVPSGIVIWNDMHYRMMGYEPGEVKPSYQAWASRVHPDDVDDVQKRIQECMAGGTVYTAEFRTRWPDGTVRWLEARGYTDYNTENKPQRQYGVMLDITEHKQAEDALRLSEERFRGLIEQAPEGIFVADTQGRYLDVNSAGAQMLGYTRDEICRMDFVDVLAPEEIERLPEAVARLADGTVNRNEWRFKRKDGSFFIGEVVGRQLPDGQLQGILRDMTAYKQAEAILKNMNEELELRVAERTYELANNMEALRIETAERLKATETLREKEQMLIQQSRQAAMGEMIGNIAHQWRQPLNTLGLYTQSLGAFYGMPNFNKEFLDNSIAKSMEIIKHMSKTIDDFRDYFKPGKGKVTFYVTEAINNTLSLLEGHFINPMITIDLVDHDNPVIYGYQNEFAQVVLNILNNARDAIIEREIVDARVIITISSENGCAVVSVADNAGGIPAEFINKVFDPYFTTKGPQVGTGIGLFMSKTIIEKNMGGKLTVRNTDIGAEFRIEVGHETHN